MRNFFSNIKSSIEQGKEIAEQIVSTAKTAATQVLNNAEEVIKSARNVTGTILSISGSIYTIQIADTIELPVLAKLMDNDLVLKVGDAVNLLGNWIDGNLVYSIISKVQDIVEQVDDVLEVAERWIDTAEEYLTPSDEDSEPSKLIYNDETLLNQIKNSGYFKVNLQCTCTDSTETNYGVRISIYGTQDGSSPLATYFFDTYSFIGQPFNCTNLAQSKIFYIDKADIASIGKIEIEPFNNGEEEEKKIPLNSITLYAGELIEIEAYLKLNTSVVNGKDYFTKTNVTEDKVTLQASLYSGDNRLTGSAVKYYWLVEDASVTGPGSNGYLDINGAGSGWYCLNPHTTITIAGEESPRTEYQTDCSTLELDSTKKSLLKKYKNRIKCLVKYGDNAITDDKLYVYNFAQENFNLKILNLSGRDLLINTSEFIELKAQFYQENTDGTETVHNFDSTKYSVEYQWKKVTNTGSEVNLVNYTNQTIKVKDLNKNSGTAVAADDTETSLIDYEMTTGQVSLVCTATVYEKAKEVDEEDVPILEESIAIADAVTIRSAINNVEVEINAVTNYKYLLAEANNLTFIKSSSSSPIDWNPGSGRTWISTNVTYSTVFEDMTIFTDTTKDWYVYYTSQTVWKQGTNTLRSDDWTYPIIARQVGYNGGVWLTLKSGASIDQLNTFNQLTRGGEDEGVYTQEGGEAVETAKTTPLVSEKYYEKVITSGNVDYTPIELVIEWTFDTDKLTETFSENTEGVWYYYIKGADDNYSRVSSTGQYDDSTTYYKLVVKKYIDENDNNTEKYQQTYVELEKNTDNFDTASVNWPEGVPATVYKNLKDNLFINASYIQTGTLRVGDAINERFYASLEDEEVRIGGFTVNENSISTSNAATKEDGTLNPYHVYLGTDGLQVGNILEIKGGHGRFNGEFTVTTADEAVILETNVYYGTSTSSTTEPTEWSKNIPEWSSDTYVWQKIENIYSKEVTDVTTLIDGEYVETKIVCLQGAQGLDGRDAITLQISSSAGFSFNTNDTGVITLEARVFSGGIELDYEGEDSQIGVVYWYIEGEGEEEPKSTGRSWSTTKQDIIGKRVYFKVSLAPFFTSEADFASMDNIALPADTEETPDEYIYTSPLVDFIGYSNGASPYQLSIDEDFISIPCDSDGGPLTGFGMPHPKISLYQGENQVTLSVDQLVLVDGNPNDIVTNLELLPDAKQIKVTLNKTKINADRMVIKFQYKDKSLLKVLAESMIEIVKQKSGAKGDTAEYVYAIADVNVVKKTDTGYSPATFTVSMYKKVGATAPFEIEDGDKFTFEVTGGTANSADYSTEITPTGNNNISVVVKQNDNIIDKLNINVVKDGVKGDSATSYWLNCSAAVHTGHNQTQSITITAMKKVGEGTEGPDNSAKLYYQYEGDSSWTPTNSESASNSIIIPASSVQNKNLIIKAYHNSTEYDSETITYSPLNTPVLDLSNDSAAMTYVMSSEDNNNFVTSDIVSSTAALYLDGEEVSDAEYIWILSNCETSQTLLDATKWSQAQGSRKNVVKNKLIQINNITQTSATATCWSFKKLYNFNHFVYRGHFQESGWSTYGTIGHEETWTASQGVQIGEYFVIIGKSTDGNKNHILWYQATTITDEGTIRGVCKAHKTFYEKDFSIAMQKQGEIGASPYSIDISNDVIRIILPDGGKITEDLTKTITVKLFKGNDDISDQLTTAPTASNTNITVAKQTGSNSNFTITIAKENGFTYGNTETITFTEKGVTSTLTIEKVFNGPKGAKGDDAVEWYIVPNATTIKKTVDNNGTVTYSPEKITTTYYQQVGNGNPSQVTSGSFGYAFTRDATSPTSLGDGIRANDLQSNKTVYFFHKASTTSSWVLWDWATFETLQDGAKGNDGTGLSGQFDFYIATENSSAPSDIGIRDQISIDSNDGNLYNGTTTPIGYSKDNFFGTSNVNGVWDIRNNNNDNKPGSKPYVWKITVIKNSLGGCLAATGFMRVSDLDAATMAAAVQVTGNSNGPGRVGTWCGYAGMSIIDGSTIVTGSVTANQIDATQLTVNNIIVPNPDNEKPPVFQATKQGTYVTFKDENGTIVSEENEIENDIVEIHAGSLNLSSVEGATNTLAGWIIDENGIWNESEFTSGGNQVTVEYGLNSNPNWTGTSLIGNGDQPVIFYCKKKGSNTYNFQLLADGSLYVTAAKFTGPNVRLEGDVTLGTETVESTLMKANISGGSSINQLLNASGIEIEEDFICNIGDYVEGNEIGLFPYGAPLVIKETYFEISLFFLGDTSQNLTWEPGMSYVDLSTKENTFRIQDPDSDYQDVGEYKSPSLITIKSLSENIGIDRIEFIFDVSMHGGASEALSSESPFYYIPFYGDKQLSKDAWIRNYLNIPSFSTPDENFCWYDPTSRPIANLVSAEEETISYIIDLTSSSFGPLFSYGLSASAEGLGFYAMDPSTDQSISSLQLKAIKIHCTGGSI